METARTDESAGVTGSAQQAASDVAEKAQELGGQALEGTRAAREQATERVREQVDQRTTQASEQASSMAQVARRVSQELRQQGSDGQAKYADQAAQRAEQVGEYLRQADADTLLRDIEDFGRRQPLALAAGGLVAGVLAARFLKASSTQRSASGGRVGSSGYGEWERSVPVTPQPPATGQAAVPPPVASGGW